MNDNGMDKMQEFMSTIASYNGHAEWLEALADDLEKATGHYSNPFPTVLWLKEEHTIWEMLVYLFGDWGTSIRSGWIVKTKECAEFIRGALTEEDEETE